MGIGDSFRNFFGKRKGPDLRHLEEWAAGHRGVEGYIEPQTSTNPTSLLLVDRDGDHARSAVRDRDHARKFCESRGIPVYDAQVIGYPKRMRDFDQRRGKAPGADLDKAIADLERRLRESPPETPNN